MAWLIRILLLEIKQKRKVHTQWKQVQVLWEEYRDAAHCHGEKTFAAKAQVGLEVAKNVGDNKKEFFQIY